MLRGDGVGAEVSNLPALLKACGLMVAAGSVMFLEPFTIMDGWGDCEYSDIS